MATEKENKDLEENTDEITQADELPVGEVQEELSEQQVFVGDEDFYEALEQNTRPSNAAARALRKARVWLGQLSIIQKLLAVCIVVIGALLSYALLSPAVPGSGDVSGPPTAPTVSARQTTPTHTAAPDSTLPAQEPTRTTTAAETDGGVTPPPSQPLSLKVAQDLYEQHDYDQAYTAYNQLCQNLPANVDFQKDFLRLKMALCLAKSAQTARAAGLLGLVSTSRSPIVAIMAHYHAGLIEMHNRQYLGARTRAYKAMALIDTVDTNRDLSASLKDACRFLVAEAMTRNILSLSDADSDLPGELWSGSTPLDPFAGLTNQQLRTLLTSGADLLDEALLAPQIREIEPQRPGDTVRFSAVCNGASIEELLARFAANAGLDIAWASETTQAPQETEANLRKRPVALYLLAATTEQLISTAAGQAGLLVSLDDDNLLHLCDPDQYSSWSQHIPLLTSRTIALWRRFLLSVNDDNRAGNAHFALGLLHARQGNTPEAIAEYKLVANRFSRSPLAPYALLHSSNLRAGLRDYAGARDDLTQLVEQYPDCEIAGRAGVYLADHTARLGLKDEAARLYRKVYNLAFSPQSQATAALGAGTCCYDTADYESAAKWLSRYVDLAANHKDRELAAACLTLGKTYAALNKPQQACRAFHLALKGQLSKEQYAQTVSALVDIYTQQEDFVRALDVLEDVDPWQFSEVESVRIILLKSAVYRRMGLVDNAIAVLGDKPQYTSDPQLKVEMTLELTDCYLAKGYLELAHKKLSEILVAAEAGPLTYKAALKLAEVCLTLGRYSQAISLCSQLQDSAASQQIKHQAAKLSAEVYDKQKDYDSAALALLGRPE